MGYTHYWQKTKETKPETWTKFTEFVKKAIKLATKDYIKICDAMGEGNFPIVDESEVSFNGFEEDSHESFYIRIEQTNGFNFCKTARRPYDAVVVACLIKAEELGVIDKWSSDGKDENGDFSDGRRLMDRC